MPDIQIKSLEGKEFGGYLAMPKGGNGPGLLVIQEIFGVNAAMRAICDDFAAKGYMALCPDLFWRQEPGVQITDQSAAEWDHAFELYKAFDVEAGVRDLLAALAHLRRTQGCSGKVGTVGYCLGGKLNYMMAARSDVDAAVSYYGVGIEKMLDEVHDIRMPTILHFAELDKFCTADIREKIIKSTSRNPAITVYTYPGVDHAFARPKGQNYNEEAATLANKRTVDFFAINLQG